MREMKLATRAAWKELERQENRDMPKKLGKLNYEEPVVSIQLTEELSDSLRQVKVRLFLQLIDVLCTKFKLDFVHLFIGFIDVVCFSEKFHVLLTF